MRRSIVRTLVAVICVALLTSTAVTLAQYDKPGDKKPAGGGTGAGMGGQPGAPEMTPEQQKEMEAWMKYMTPGPEHKRMAEQFGGTWDAEVTMWMDPAAPPQKSTGTMKNEAMFGGRYLHHMFKGAPMMGMPGPFEGAGTMAYDNALKKYIGTWMDNMGTGTMYMTGTYDESKKQYTLTGDQPNPMDGKMMKFREVLTVHDNNSHTAEMYMPGRDGKEMKCMEIKYTRKS